MAEIKIRAGSAADAKSIERVRAATWHTSYGNLLPKSAIDEATKGWAERWQFRPDLKHFAFIAESAGDGPVGFVIGGPSRETWPDYPGEIYLIYVLEGFQGQGIGRQLMLKAHDALANAGLSPYFLMAIAESKPSLGFYDRAGGSNLDRDKKFDIGGTPLTDRAIGWTKKPFSA